MKNIQQDSKDCVTVLVAYLRDEGNRFLISQAIRLFILIFGLWWFWTYHMGLAKSWSEEDPVGLFTYTTVIVVLACSLLFDRDQIGMVRGLHDSGVINITAKHWLEIKMALKCRSLYWQVGTVSVMLILTFWGYEEFFGFLDSPDRICSQWEIFLAGGLGAGIVGHIIGRVLANAFAVCVIGNFSRSFELTMDHPDGVGGLDRIGRFYILQGLIVLILISSLMIGMWIIPHGYEEQYGKWLPHYQRLLVFYILILIIGIGFPMLFYRNRIKRWKDKHKCIIKRIRSEIVDLRKGDCRSASNRSQIGELSQYLYSLVNLPDWPLSPVTIRLFFVSILVPAILTSVVIFADLLKKAG